jgi:hypothetical protein
MAAGVKQRDGRLDLVIDPGRLPIFSLLCTKTDNIDKCSVRCCFEAT